MTLKAWLYDYKTGNGIREEVVVGTPTHSWDYEGENAADIRIQAPAIEAFEEDYEPYKHGLVIFNDNTRKVLHAGPISKSLISMEEETITLGIGSTLDYFSHLYVYPYTPVTSSESAFTIPSGTQEVEAARRLLRYPWTGGAPQISGEPTPPENINIQVVSNSSRYTLSEDYKVYFSDGMSVRDALEELMGFRQGIEAREVYSLSGSTTPHVETTLHLYNRFGENDQYLPYRMLDKNNVLSYQISEEPYTISRVIAVSRDSDEDENIQSDLQHRTKTGTSLLFDTFESLQEEATNAEMDSILSSRLNAERYSSSIYEISIYDDREEVQVMEDLIGARITSAIPRLGTKARIIGITHEAGTKKYDLEITTDWSVLVYPQPTRKKKKEDAEKRQKDRKNKNQKPRKGNYPGFKQPPGGNWGDNLFPKPEIPDFPDPEPDPDPGGGGGGGNLPNPDGSTPLPDANDSLGDGFDSKGETLWRITDEKVWDYWSFPGYRSSIRTSVSSNNVGVRQSADINERGEVFTMAHQMSEASGGILPRLYGAGSTWPEVSQTSLGLEKRNIDNNLFQYSSFPFEGQTIQPFAIFREIPDGGQLGEIEKFTEDIIIDEELYNRMGFHPTHFDVPEVGRVYPTSITISVPQHVVVGETVFILVHLVSYKSASRSGDSMNQIKILKITKDKTEILPNGYFQGRMRDGRTGYDMETPEGDEAVPGMPLFRPFPHQQAIGGYKLASVGSGVRLVNMFDKNFSPVPNIDRERFGIYPTSSNKWDDSYMSQPILYQGALNSIKWTAYGRTEDRLKRQIIDTPIDGRVPRPKTPWTHVRSFSDDTTGTYRSGVFQVMGNAFYRLGGGQDAAYYYMDAETKNMSILSEGGYSFREEGTFSKGQWLYNLGRPRNTIFSGGRAYRIEPYEAGSAYPERGGGDADDLFVYYDFDQLQIKTPDAIGDIEVKEYLLRVWQEGISEMETDKYEPRGSYGFRFKENGFQEDTETFVQWTVTAASSKFNVDEDGNPAPAYQVTVSLTPEEGGTGGISGEPTVVDNYKDGEGWTAED